METIIRQYLHRPNATELGIGNTHETYMLISSNTDLSRMFPPGVEIVVEDTVSKKAYTLKSAYGGEFRVNQMGPIYRDYDMRPGDEILITGIEKGGVSKLFLTVRKFKRVGLAVTKKGVELSNEDNLKGYGDSTARSYTVNVLDRGVSAKLTLRFKQSLKKRSDSPAETDYFEAKLGDDPLISGTHYLTLSEKSTLSSLLKSEYNEIKYDDSISFQKMNTNFSLQQIFYGAPGTGKSNKTKAVAEMYPDTIRTTFHPDSDYSTFVGAYKPTMEMLDICDETGEVATIGNKKLQKKQITYKFVKQAFLKAYVKAWQKFRKAASTEDIEPQFLVIEEINRGNCAQIFGDLFQLLDRKNGFSEYPIEADEDLAKSLLEKDSNENPSFGEHGLELDDDKKAIIKSQFANSKDDIAEKICKGQVLVLPPNLYIWATMNTSDQSLFPIDSAFKRRWDWKYVRIINHPEKTWHIKFEYVDETGNIQQEDKDWWHFLKSINKLIKEATHSEDKQLGYFFCKAKDDQEITAEAFVGKVIFYLWNDVFKTMGYRKTIFGDMDFDTFYLDDAQDQGGNPEGLDKLKVHQFIERVIEKANEL